MIAVLPGAERKEQRAWRREHRRLALRIRECVLELVQPELGGGIAAHGFYGPHYAAWASGLVRDRWPVLAFVRAAPPGPVLDLGGGFGRMALHLAAMGREVVVTDSSEPMLDLGRRVARRLGLHGRIEWVHQDFTDPGAVLRERFPVILSAHRAINEVLGPAEPFFRLIAASLAPEGRAHLTFAHRPSRPGVVEVQGEFTTPAGELWVVAAVSRGRGTAREPNTLSVLYDRYRDSRLVDRQIARLDRRFWHPDEIERAARGAGLAVCGAARGEARYRTNPSNTSITLAMSPG